MEELENKKIRLDGLCTAHKEENVRVNQALNNFLERYNEIYTWLVTIAEAFLQGHQDMGSDLLMAKDFFELHNQLLNDLQVGHKLKFYCHFQYAWLHLDGNIKS